jgi:FMN phosphatase YigB (HAD superfamily)
MIKAIIFDWGRTLYDSENHHLFPQTKRILESLKKHYILAIVSLASDGNLERRREILHSSGIEQYFSIIHFAQSDKESLYERTLAELALQPQEVAVVDDRTVRGIRWGNKRGATTIWLKKGKFSSEEPDNDTGMPHHIISNIEELENLFPY